MKIVCAASVFMGEEAFSTLGQTVVVPDASISRADLLHADALIVRSKTRVCEDLLRGTKVSFVGTATAGIDHMDTGYLDAADIAWCAAYGCNANSVAEYVVAALLNLAGRHSLVLEELTLGVVGVGHVGSAVVAKAEALGMRVLKNDPPLRETTGSIDYEPLEQVLRGSDIITLHVPLVHCRPWPTFHMANYRFFEMMKPGSFFINAARGEVMDSEAVLDSLRQKVLRAAVLDVWEDEPCYRTDLLDKVALGSPHIAGYSLEGRFNGTWMVYHDAARFFEVEPTWRPRDLERGLGATELEVDGRGRTDEEILADMVEEVYNIRTDDKLLRDGALLGDRERGEYFSMLRRSYAIRREFPATNVILHHATPTLQRKVVGLGFHLDPGSQA
jgi:erythronate-4-phosphate dehydrogenase